MVPLGYSRIHQKSTNYLRQILRQKVCDIFWYCRVFYSSLQPRIFQLNSLDSCIDCTCLLVYGLFTSWLRTLIHSPSTFYAQKSTFLFQNSLHPCIIFTLPLLYGLFANWRQTLIHSPSTFYAHKPTFLFPTSLHLCIVFTIPPLYGLFVSWRRTLIHSPSTFYAQLET